jgi:hypothetical protein
LETVIANQLIAFLDKHNIFNESQFGFRKKKSTNDAIVTFIENIIDNMNDESKCNCVLLDLTKTFGYIQHNILMDKLYDFGVRGIPHKLIKSYVTNRTQLVKVTHILENLQMKIIICQVASQLDVESLRYQSSDHYFLSCNVNDIQLMTHGRSIMYADDARYE